MLAIPIVVVSVPAWSDRCVCLEHIVDHFEAGDHGRVVRSADTVANQLQKATIDDVAGRIIALLTGRMIGDMQDARFLVFGRMLLADLLGQDPHVVWGLGPGERARRRHRPVFYVGFEVIGIFLDENGGFRIAALPEEKCSADESCNIRG